MIHRARGAVWARVALLVLFGSCGGGGESGGVTPPPPTPTVVLSAASTALTASTSSPATTTVSIVRGGGFGGAVTLTAENLPSGVTAAFGTATLAAASTSTTLTLTVTPAAVAAVTSITIRAAGTGVAVSTVVLPLTVTVPSINLSTPSAAVSATAGSNATVVLTLERLGGFAGAVNVALEGLPANVTGSFAPASLAAGITSSTLTIVVGANAAAGTTPLTVRATGTGIADRTLVVQLTVGAAPLIPITFTFCDASRVPVFFVVRDGLAGAWRTVTPTANTYTFTLAGNIGSVAVMWLNPLNRLFVVYETYSYTISGTSAELAARFAFECVLQPARGKSLSGSIAPAVGAQELAFVSAGWGNALLSPGGSAYSLPDVAPGGIDLIATRFSFNAGLNGYLPTQMILRRAVNQANGATLSVLDFASNESFAPATATITVGNQNGERVSLRSAFNSATSAQLVLDNGIQTTGATHTQYGIPEGRLLATDLHEATVTASDASNTVFRQVVATSRTVTNRTLTLGSVPAAPTVSVSNGLVARPRVRGPLQADYNKSVIVLFTQTIARKQAYVEVTPGYLGAAASYDLEVPDLSGVSGYNAAWGLTVGAQTAYGLYVSNAPYAFATAAAGVLWSNGDTFLFGTRVGNVP